MQQKRHASRSAMTIELADEDQIAGRRLVRMVWTYSLALAAEILQSWDVADRSKQAVSFYAYNEDAMPL